MSNNSVPEERIHKIRFSNNRTTDMIVGVEPLGLYHDVPPEKDMDVVFYLYDDVNDEYALHTFYVEEDGSIVLDISSADVTVYIDNKEVYPHRMNG